MQLEVVFVYFCFKYDYNCFGSVWTILALGSVGSGKLPLVLTTNPAASLDFSKCSHKDACSRIIKKEKPVRATCRVNPKPLLSKHIFFQRGGHRQPNLALYITASLCMC